MIRAQPVIVRVPLCRGPWGHTRSPARLTLGAHGHMEGGVELPPAKGRAGVRSQARRRRRGGRLGEGGGGARGGLRPPCVASDKHNIAENKTGEDWGRGT